MKYSAIFPTATVKKSTFLKSGTRGIIPYSILWIKTDSNILYIVTLSTNVVRVSVWHLHGQLRLDSRCSMNIGGSP